MGTPAHLTPGRRVELRRGYRSQEDALWGRVAHMVEATSLAAFFEKVPFHLVIPVARSREEALERASSILGIARLKSPQRLLGSRWRCCERDSFSG